MRRYISVDDFARMIAKSRATVYRICERREIEYLRVGEKGISIPLDAAQTYIERNTIEPKPIIVGGIDVSRRFA